MQHTHIHTHIYIPSMSIYITIKLYKTTINDSTMEWSPQDAMKAYLHTLHLCKTNKVIEPRCMELVSALAAGKRARLMVQVSTQGITPLTVALAAAAKQTGGRLVCILPQHQKALLINDDLEDVVELDYGDPCVLIQKYSSIDFAVIDCKFEHHLKLYKLLKLNPGGSTVVANNVKPVKERVDSFVEIWKAGKENVESVILPIGEGMELIRSNQQRSRKCKRFYVTYETF